MTSDLEKLYRITFYDIVTWHQGEVEVSGLVHGFTSQSRGNSQHVIVARSDSHHEEVIPLADIVRRKRPGTYNGIVRFQS